MTAQITLPNVSRGMRSLASPRSICRIAYTKS